jgi:hypothetical protein
MNLLPSTLKKIKRFKPVTKWKETFICPCCKREISWECGATDSDLCDDCETGGK